MVFPVSSWRVASAFACGILGFACSAPQSAVPQSAVPQSAVPQSAVPQTAVPQTATTSPTDAPSGQSACAESAPLAGDQEALRVSEAKQAPEQMVEPEVTSAPKEVCVVLSVGAERGLSHIGVLTALREQGVPVTCVVGNSMGALLGGFYAADPKRDLASEYRSLFQDYEVKSRADAGPLGVRALLGFNKQDWGRLKRVIGTRLGTRRIESLPIPFATEHQVSDKSGIRIEPVRGGVLSDEIARSIANPFLFPDIEMKEDAAFDPGADRVSAVPLELACELFPEKQFIVSNVTEHPPFISSKTTCPYTEVRVPEVPLDRALAIRGKEPGLRQLIAAGYAATMNGLDFKSVAAEGSAKSPPLEYVEVTLELSLPGNHPSGASWDGPGGGLPEPWITTTIKACKGCDAYGTSDGIEYETDGNSTLRVKQHLGMVALRRGFTLSVHVRERDVSSDDEIGTFEFVYGGAGKQEHAPLKGMKVKLLFE